MAGILSQQMLFNLATLYPFLPEVDAMLQDATLDTWALVARGLEIQPSIVWARMVALGLLIPDNVPYTKRVIEGQPGSILLPVDTPGIADVYVRHGQPVGNLAQVANVPFVPEHHWQMARLNGPLDLDEMVYHIDSQMWNNWPANLWRCNVLDAQRARDSLATAVGKLYQWGALSFQDGSYRLTRTEADIAYGQGK